MKQQIIAVAAAALVLAAVVHGQVAGANFLGNKTCLACHKLKHKPIVDAYPETAHAKAMQEASDEVIVGDFANAPFDRAKVAYVLGRGRHEQAYLDADLKVLPGLWLVDEQKWTAQEAVDGATECVGCHTTDFNPETKQWKQLGVGCERCHGPGSKHLSAKPDTRSTTIVRPQSLDPQHQAMVCGQCHSQGRAKSGKTRFPDPFLPGGDLTAVFTDAKLQEPARNQQYSDLVQSPKHWDAGIVCEKCHDPHGNTGQPYQLKAPINDTCTQCHEDHQDLAAHVAAKGKQAPADATCATCHMPGGRHLFDKTIAD